MNSNRLTHTIFALTMLLVLAFGGRVVSASSTAVTGLNGTYNIGGPSQDYATISAAVAALNFRGIAGDVTFRISGGTYDEQVTIDDFPRDAGAEEATVTFVANVAGSPPTWQFSSAVQANNWVILLDGAHHIIIDNIDFPAAAVDPYSRHIVFAGQAHHITVRNCSFTGHPGADLDLGSLIYREDDDAHDHNSFVDNTFTYGYRGIDWDATIGGEASYEMLVSGNMFAEQYNAGMYLAAVDNGSVDGNRVTNTVNSDNIFKAIYVEKGFTPVPVALPLIIANNEIDMPAGRYGIQVVDDGAASSDRDVVANNLVTMRHATESWGGIAVAENSVDVVHNTVHTVGDAIPLIVDDQDDVAIFNNIFSAEGGAPAMYIDYPTSFESDYNNLYSTGATLVQINNNDFATLSAYQSANVALGQDQHAVSVVTTFVDTVGVHDLRLAAPSTDDDALVAPALPDHTTDVDGELRGSYLVYKGADEGNGKLPLDNGDTVNGYYTVATASADFTGPSQALFALRQRGIKGDVTIRVPSGTYNVHEHLVFAQFDGTHSVTIEGTNAANRPIFTHAATNADDNYLLKVSDSGVVRLYDIEFEATGAGGFGRLLHIDGQSRNLLIENCQFTGLTNRISTDAALIYAYTPLIDPTEAGQTNHSVSDSTFINGSFGIYQSGARFGGNGAAHSVSNSQFTGQYAAAIFSDHDDLFINNNDIESSRGGATGIELSSVHDATVQSNVIAVRGGNSVGIRIVSSNGNNVFDFGMVVNNAVIARDGIRFENNSSLWNVYHNTVHVTGTALFINPDTTAFAEVEINAVNNILRSPAGGLALSIEDPTSIGTVNYNNLGNTGGTLVHWDGTDYATLADYQAVSGLDANSVDKEVFYTDLTTNNFHLTGASLGDFDLAGTPLALVPLDFDAQTRSTTFPYMGADEASAIELPTAVQMRGQGVNSAESLTTIIFTFSLLLLTVRFTYRQRRPGPNSVAVNLD